MRRKEFLQKILKLNLLKHSAQERSIKNYIFLIIIVSNPFKNVLILINHSQLILLIF